MIALISGGTSSLKRHGVAGCVGHLHTPDGRHDISKYWLPYAADNSAFCGFDEAKYRRMLDRIAASGKRPIFVTVPDVVCDPVETLRLFDAWAPTLEGLDLPAAFVAQDGCENLPIPWGRFSSLFIGGSTEWKLGEAAAELCIEAKRRGLWVHVGRVNTMRRLRIAWAMRADSFDGSKWSRFGETYLPQLMRSLSAPSQLCLID